MLTDAEFETKLAAWEAERDRRFAAIHRDGSAFTKAFLRWEGNRGEDAWQKTVAGADEQYQSGRFLMEQLGAESYLHPELMATLWLLRQQLLVDSGADDAASSILVDMTILAYANTLRVQSWIGNASSLLERELWGQESPTVKLKQRYGFRVEGLAVEDVVSRLVEQLVPLLDRTNKMLVRNLKALKELKQQPAPTVAIQQAGQVNLGAQQVNTVTEGVPPYSDVVRNSYERKQI